MEFHQVMKNIKSLNLISISTHLNVCKSQPVVLPYMIENRKYLQCMIVMQKLFFQRIVVTLMISVNRNKNVT